MALHDWAADWTNLGIQAGGFYVLYYVTLWLVTSYREASRQAIYAAVGLWLLVFGFVYRVGYWYAAATIGPVGQKYLRCTMDMSSCTREVVSLPPWSIEGRIWLPISMAAAVLGMTLLMATLRGVGCGRAFIESFFIIAGTALFAWITMG